MNIIFPSAVDHGNSAKKSSQVNPRDASEVRAEEMQSFKEQQNTVFSNPILTTFSDTVFPTLKMKNPQGKAHRLIQVMSVMCGQLNSSLKVSWNEKKKSLNNWIHQNENKSGLSKIVLYIQVSLV